MRHIVELNKARAVDAEASNRRTTMLRAGGSVDQEDIEAWVERHLRAYPTTTFIDRYGDGGSTPCAVTTRHCDIGHCARLFVAGAVSKNQAARLDRIPMPTPKRRSVQRTSPRRGQRTTRKQPHRGVQRIKPTVKIQHAAVTPPLRAFRGPDSRVSRQPGVVDRPLPG